MTMETMQLMFRMLRRLPVGDLRTAEQLAQELGVTRADVARAVDEAREYGVDIQTRRGRGYALLDSIDWLDAYQTRQAMGDRGERYQLRIADDVISTNDVVLAEGGGAYAGRLAVAAELQAAGRGRRGRRWNSGLGNALTFSVLYRFSQPNAALSASSLVVGVALMRALKELGVRDAMLKWPNDLITSDGKLGGVLIETCGERASALSTIIIGIGINVRLPGRLEAAIDQPAVDLHRLGVRANRSTILGVCLRHLDETMAQFEAEGFANLRQEWTAHAAYISKPVVLAHAHGQVETGVMGGIAADGSLLLTTAKGQQKVYSGDISLRCIPASHP